MAGRSDGDVVAMQRWMSDELSHAQDTMSQEQRRVLGQSDATMSTS
jgi:hypothetical protein